MNISVSNLFMMSQIVHPSPLNDAYLKRISYTLRLEFQREFMRTLRTDWLKKKKKTTSGLTRDEETSKIWIILQTGSG